MYLGIRTISTKCVGAISRRRPCCYQDLRQDQLVWIGLDIELANPPGRTLETTFWLVQP